MQKKVLLVTYHFPPSAASGSFRLLGFARHLPRAGWQPLVVAPPQLPWEPVDPDLARDVLADVLVRSVPYPRRAPWLLRALAPEAIWLPRAWSACRAVVREHRPDVVLTSGPPHWVHLLGMSLKHSFGIPWVADFRDPWITQGATGTPRWRERWPQYCERKVFAAADAILANAPNACRLFQSAYPAQANKVVTLTNGFDPTSLPPAPPQADPIRLVYAGELYHGRDPLPLLDALARWNLHAPRRAHLEVMGRNELSVNLADEIHRRGLGNDVTLTRQRPYQEALTAMAQASILVLFDSPGRTIGVPAKLYEYFGARRPILALAEPAGDVAHVLRDSGVPHRLASPRDPEQIEQALADLLHQLDGAPYRAADGQRLHRYARAHLAQELGALLDRLCPAARGPAQILATRVVTRDSGKRRAQEVT